MKNITVNLQEVSGEERRGEAMPGEARRGEARKGEKRIRPFFRSAEKNILLTLSHLSGQQNPSAEKTKLALNSRNFFRNSLGFASSITS